LQEIPESAIHTCHSVLDTESSEKQEIAGKARNDNKINDIVIYLFSINGNLDMDISTLPNERLKPFPKKF